MRCDLGRPQKILQTLCSNRHVTRVLIINIRSVQEILGLPDFADGQPQVCTGCAGLHKVDGNGLTWRKRGGIDANLSRVGYVERRLDDSFDPPPDCRRKRANALIRICGRTTLPKNRSSHSSNK